MLAATALCLSTANASAAVVDLTPGSGSTGTINGATYSFNKLRGGTGNIQSFVRIQATGTEQGYNTTVSSNSALPFNETYGSFTHNLQLNEIPIIEVSGVDYFEFLLDVNESSGGGNEFISLDLVQIYTSPTPGQNTTNVATLGTLRYDMDAGPNSHVRLDYSLNSGSGTTDMCLYLPISFFAGAAITDYVYLYSQFGGQGTISGQKYGTSDGFEEWALEVMDDSVFLPEPATLALFALAPLFAIRSPRRHA
jgi:hypothetical protein